MTCIMGPWAGKQRVHAVIPHFVRAVPPPGIPAAVAKEGYAVGGIHADGMQFINAISIIFMRVKEDGNLDPADSYTSDWLGTPHDKSATTIHGNGKVVIGVHGRTQAIMDAIGLVYQK